MRGDVRCLGILFIVGLRLQNGPPGPKRAIRCFACPLPSGSAICRSRCGRSWPACLRSSPRTRGSGLKQAGAATRRRWPSIGRPSASMPCISAASSGHGADHERQTRTLLARCDRYGGHADSGWSGAGCDDARQLPPILSGEINVDPDLATGWAVRRCCSVAQGDLASDRLRSIDALDVSWQRCFGAPSDVPSTALLRSSPGAVSMGHV